MKNRTAQEQLGFTREELYTTAKNLLAKAKLLEAIATEIRLEVGVLNDEHENLCLIENNKLPQIKSYLDPDDARDSARDIELEMRANQEAE